MAKFGPLPAPKWSEIIHTDLFSMHFILGINVAFTIFDLKSISEAGGHPDGQFWAISGHFQPVPAPYMVQDCPD